MKRIVLPDPAGTEPIGRQSKTTGQVWVQPPFPLADYVVTLGDSKTTTLFESVGLVYTRFMNI
ncbi:MAG: hypothetical protein U0R23_05090 [Candidatus Nanopelagicales bacterium]